jgi:hypothetical protein
LSLELQIDARRAADNVALVSSLSRELKKPVPRFWPAWKKATPELPC